MRGGVVLDLSVCGYEEGVGSGEHRNEHPDSIKC